MKKLICLVLCMAMSLAMVNVAMAETTVIVQPKYSHTLLITVSFNLTAGIARAAGEIQPRDDYETRVTVRLQQKVGNSWITLETWTGHKDPGTSEAGGTRSVDLGYSYRVYVIGRVFDDNGYVLETVSKYSDVKTYGTLVS